MVKLYQIELDRNERDFATFLKSREVSLSQNELRVLIASTAFEDREGMFRASSFIANLKARKTIDKKLLKNNISKNIKKELKLSIDLDS